MKVFESLCQSEKIKGEKRNTMKRRDLSSNEENVEASPEPPMHKKHHELISAYTLAQKIA